MPGCRTHLGFSSSRIHWTLLIKIMVFGTNSTTAAYCNSDSYYNSTTASYNNSTSNKNSSTASYNNSTTDSYYNSTTDYYYNSDS